MHEKERELLAKQPFPLCEEPAVMRLLGRGTGKGQLEVLEGRSSSPAETMTEYSAMARELERSKNRETC